MEWNYSVYFCVAITQTTLAITQNKNTYEFFIHPQKKKKWEADGNFPINPHKLLWEFFCPPSELKLRILENEESQGKSQNWVQTLCLVPSFPSRYKFQLLNFQSLIYQLLTFPEKSYITQFGEFVSYYIVKNCWYFQIEVNLICTFSYLNHMFIFTYIFVVNIYFILPASCKWRYCVSVF